MPHYLTVAEFEALVCERVKTLRPGKFPAVSAARRRAEVDARSRRQREVARRSRALSESRRRQAYSRNLRALAEVVV